MPMSHTRKLMGAAKSLYDKNVPIIPITVDKKATGKWAGLEDGFDWVDIERDIDRGVAKGIAINLAYTDWLDIECDSEEAETHLQ